MTWLAAPQVAHMACEGAALLVWTFMLLALPVADVAADVARVEAAYRRAGGITAMFTQTYHDRMSQRPRRESGQLWVAPDGRVHWTYLTPERKEFVFDGKTAYFWEPEQEQVTILDDFQNSPLATATGFLWGQGNLTKTFDVGACTPRPKELGEAVHVPDDEVCASLTPSAALSRQVQEVVLGVDPKGLRIRRSFVVDTLGNTMAFAFHQVRFGEPQDPALFRFQVPEGVTILKPDTTAPPAGPS